MELGLELTPSHGDVGITTQSHGREAHPGARRARSPGPGGDGSRAPGKFAYDDRPLPIEADQTISQPYIVALMTEALRLEPDEDASEPSALVSS